MAIEFHCNKCGQMVRAPDDAGGKRGKCPACHQSVYIPTPSDEIEPLDLAPIDEEAEREQERLRREASELQSNLLRERELPESAREPALASGANTFLPKLEPRELVLGYLSAMADGNLQQADAYAAQAARDKSAIDDAITHIFEQDELPEQIAHLPPPVVKAFVKQLRDAT